MRQIDELRKTMTSNNQRKLLAEIEDWINEEVPIPAGLMDPTGLHTIDCGIGTIQWTADNLQLQSRIEELLAPLAITPQTVML